ncbi:hypothetical protein GCM10023196_041760 [Actinoallomurus vinaceus]|uniref:Secreted protein n=1 Tax=Actinoallomurus vinaceus TaxID=1080074 RepID=A0ABP8UAM8_9ACTN
MRIRTTLAGMAVGASMILPVSFIGASPASAATCTPWHDKNTYGVNCTGSGRWYQAVGVCNDGNYVWGDTNYSGWAYAYCYADGGLNYGYRRWVS